MQKHKTIGIVWFLFIALCFLGSQPAFSEELCKVRLACMSENEAFPFWYAKKKGWDKEQNLDITILKFQSGKNIFDSFQGFSFDFATCGAIPLAFSESLRQVSLLAVTNDESINNVIFVRGDSDILKTKGYNKAYPEVYGSPESIRGKQILCPQNTSAHYVLAKWLDIFGLTVDDVIIQFMEISVAHNAFASGTGDVISLWNPYGYDLEKVGFRIAANASACQVHHPTVLIASKLFTEKHPQLTQDFLHVYFRAIECIKNEDSKAMTERYVSFFKEFGGIDVTLEEAERDMATHTLYSREEQEKLFDRQNTVNIYDYWLDAIQTFVSSNKKRKFQDNFGITNIVNDSFLK